MEKYYTTEEVEAGIEGLPKFSKTTLRTLRAARKIRYTKLGNSCLYTKEWLLEYLNANVVDRRVSGGS